LSEPNAFSGVDDRSQADHYRPSRAERETIGFLSVAATTPDVQRLLDADIAECGYVTNLSRLWAYEPTAKRRLFDLLAHADSVAGLSLRQRAILIAACASAIGDSYCSLMWGSKLAEVSDPDTAAAVLRGSGHSLSAEERAVADWARSVARDPNGTCAADVQSLRDAGFSDAQIFGITLLISLRLAFSTMNDALGVHPDAVLRSTVPAAVRDAVISGRPIEEGDPPDAPPPTDASRAFAKQLAADAIANGDATGWFETLYAAAEQGTVTVPWADFAPNRRLVAAMTGLRGGGDAVVIGCGLGDDAEFLASLGYTTVAFDVSPTAIARARRRFPHSTVQYVAADLLSPPRSWFGAFDLVVEIYTLQVLSGAARRTAIARTAQLVAPGGRLLVIAAARDEHDDAGTMPWPLTRAEIVSFETQGLVKDSIVDFFDDEGGRLVRRWRAWFTAPTSEHPMTDRPSRSRFGTASQQRTGE
jgi:alkylhydroperoxidase family enzyme/SAM-dependent methyltransferase